MIKMRVVCCSVYEKGNANVTFVAKLATTSQHFAVQGMKIIYFVGFVVG